MNFDDIVCQELSQKYLMETIQCYGKNIIKYLFEFSLFVTFPLNYQVGQNLNLVPYYYLLTFYSLIYLINVYNYLS